MEITESNIQNNIKKGLYDNMICHEMTNKIIRTNQNKLQHFIYQLVLFKNNYWSLSLKIMINTNLFKDTFMKN